MNIPAETASERPKVSGEDRETNIAWISCFAIAVVAYGIFFTHGMALAVIGYNLAPAERVLLGEQPYRDFLYNYTPGVLWLNALVFKLAGTSLVTARVVVLIAKVFTVLVLFSLGRKFILGLTVAIPVLMTIAWIGYGDVLKVFPSQYGLLFLMLSCIALINARRTSWPVRWLVLAGLMAGIVLVFKHNVGVFTLAAACAGAALVRPSNGGNYTLRSEIPARLKWVSAVILGFLLIAGPMCIYLALNRAFIPMVSHFASHATAYTDAKSAPLPAPSVLLIATLIIGIIFIGVYLLSKRAPRAAYYIFFSAFMIISVLILFCDRGICNKTTQSFEAQVYYLPVTLCVISLAWLARSLWLIRKDTKKNGLSENANTGLDNSRAFIIDIAILSFFAIAAFLEIFPRSDLDHLIRVLPPSFLFLTVLIKKGVSGIAMKTSANSPYLLMITAIALIIISLGIKITWKPQFGPGMQLVENSPLEFKRGLGVCGAYPEAERLNWIVSYIETNSSPGEPILALSRKMTGVYFLAARPNITRLTWPDSAGLKEADLEGVINSIQAHRFKFILIGADQGTPVVSTAPRDHRRGLMLDAVRSHYRIVAEMMEVSIYAPTNKDN